ncbi:putative ribonuclease H-like domain-containing protein [Tanacetum coccineum]
MKSNTNMNCGLSYEKEVLESVFDSRSSDAEDSHVNDRFIKVEGLHAVPPSMTGIYMPSKFDFGIDESKFTYGRKQSKTSESNAKTSDTASYESNSSVETPDFVSKPTVNEPTAVSKSKVWSNAPIIKEYESDSDDEYVIEPSKEQEKPSFAFVNTVKHVKSHRKTVKEQNTYSSILKADKRDWNVLMSKKLGLRYGFTKKACFVCGNFSHLIRDYDFQEKRMAKQVELNKQKGKATGQGENRPVWNNIKSFWSSNNNYTARKVNTARPIVNEIRPRNNFYKSHSPIRRPFNRTTAPKANFTNLKVNTVGDKTVSVVGGNRETAVKASAGCNWRPKRHYWNKVSKYNSGSNFSKNDDPQKALKNKGIVDSGWIKKEYSNARTPQQNGVAERKNMTLIEAARTMLADSFLPNTFWAEAVSTTCYVLNIVVVTRTAASNGNLTDEQRTSRRKRTVAECDGVEYRIHSIHPTNQILGDPTSAVQTRSKVHKSSEAHAFVSYIQKQRRNNHKDFQHCLFACFLSQIELKKISQALEDESWVDAMQEKLLQFKIQKVWIMVYLPFRKRVDIEDEPLKTPFSSRRTKNDIMLVQVYVDDIIFGSTKKSWCDDFEPLMKSIFQISFMGELTLFLGLQVNPKISHLHAVKRIFRYLKDKTKLGLWYPRVSSFDLEAYSDSDYAGANLDRKSTTEFVNS